MCNACASIFRSSAVLSAWRARSAPRKNALPASERRHTFIFLAPVVRISPVGEPPARFTCFADRVASRARHAANTAEPLLGRGAVLWLFGCRDDDDIHLFERELAGNIC